MIFHWFCNYYVVFMDNEPTSYFVARTIVSDYAAIPKEDWISVNSPIPASWGIGNAPDEAELAQEVATEGLVPEEMSVDMGEAYGGSLW